MCVVNQAPRTDWGLNLDSIPALFAVRNYWSSNYSYGPYDAICFIENCHWINANELVDFEVNVDTPSGCKIGCINSMASNVLADARI